MGSNFQEAQQIAVASNVVPVAEGLASIAPFQNTYNNIANFSNPIITTPTFRTSVGVVMVGSGLFNILGGGILSFGGASAQVLPVIGQIGGGTALVLGGLETAYGCHKLKSGIADFTQGLQGNGYNAIPLFTTPTIDASGNLYFSPQ